MYPNLKDKTIKEIGQILWSLLFSIYLQLYH